MKHNRIVQIACLALIIAGVFFTTSHAQAVNVFPHPSSTGCTAPAGGDAIGPCGNVHQHAAAPAAPKHWHRHWHRHYHFRFHHFRGHRGHSGHHFHHHHH